MMFGNLLEDEQAFFDQEAATLKDAELLLAAREIERYHHARPNPLNIALDALFVQLLPLEGKHVLDYGCGHGQNALLLAACGAGQGTAFDLSPVSAWKPRRRPDLNVLADPL